MEVVKLGKKGQVTIPRSILKALGIPEDAPLLVNTTPDGAIVLRQAGVFPIELYTEEQIREYEALNTIPSALDKRARALVRKHGDNK